MNALSRPRSSSQKLIKVLVGDGLSYFLVSSFISLYREHTLNEDVVDFITSNSRLSDDCGSSGRLYSVKVASTS